MSEHSTGLTRNAADPPDRWDVPVITIQDSPGVINIQDSPLVNSNDLQVMSPRQVLQNAENPAFWTAKSVSSSSK